MPNSIVEVNDVTKIYDSVIVAVSECSFILKPGITGFLGPNGAGKSTIIKLLVGDLRPTLGSVAVLGDDPWNNYMLHRRIGYISEITSQFDFLTPIKLSTYLGRLGGLSREQAVSKAFEVLKMVGMGEFYNRKLTQLSKGMKQRVKIANSFLLDPELIIADEPMSGLDPLGRSAIFTAFQEFASNGGSVFLSSHILFEVERITKELILIYNGQIVAQGQTKEIRATLSEYPYHFEIQTNDPQTLGKMLLDEFEVVKSIEFKEINNGFFKSNSRSIIVTTTKPTTLFDVLTKLNQKHGIKIYSMLNLEEQVETETIFNYIINS